MVSGLQVKLAIRQDGQWLIQDGVRSVAIQSIMPRLRLAIMFESGDEQFVIDLMDPDTANRYQILEGFPKLIIESENGLGSLHAKTLELTVLSEQIPQQTHFQIFERFTNMIKFISCFCNCRSNTIIPEACSTFSEPSSVLSTPIPIPSEPNFLAGQISIVDQELVPSYFKRLRYDRKFQYYCQEIESVWMSHCR